MSERFVLPFVWPSAMNEVAFESPSPWDPPIEGSVIGVVCDLDRQGVQHLKAMVTGQVKIKLVIAIYAASPTDRAILEELLQLANSSSGVAEFALSARALDSNAAGITGLLVTSASGVSRAWIGNTPNLGCAPKKNGHLNLYFEANQALTNRFISWFADLWENCTPLTAETAAVPSFVRARGSEDAAERWSGYEELLCSRFRLQVVANGSSVISTVVGADPSAIGETPQRGESPTEILCKQLNIPRPDKLKEKVEDLLARGEIVTIDKSGRVPPLELPVRSDWFGGQNVTVGTISRTSSYRIRIFDEKQSKELEARRKGLSDLIQRLTYPFADGVRWIPKKAQPLLEHERERLEREAKQIVQSLVGENASEFAATRRKAIEQDANDMYKKVCPDAGQLPVSTLNLIYRDLEDRLVKATEGAFLPKVTYMAAEFSRSADSENLSLWAPARTLLAATAEYYRNAAIGSKHMKRLEIEEKELLAAMDVCGDWIVSEERNSLTVKTAKQEISHLQEIIEKDISDRSKCEQILALIERRAG